MRALLVTLSALLVTAGVAHAKDMAAGAECYVLGRTYGFEMKSLGRIESREPFHRYESTTPFVDVMFLPFAVFNEHQHRAHEAAGDAQYRRVAELLSCGLEKGCDWAKTPGADRTPSGRPIVRTECPS